MGKNMSKSEHTKIQLMKALERILANKTERISPERKLSIKAVEEEAGLGNGSAYYYKDVITKIREKLVTANSKIQFSPNEHETALVSKLRKSLNTEKRLKEKYRTEVTVLRKKLSLMAAQQNSMTLKIQLYLTKISEIENSVIKINT